jgi:preprotein translocase subunit SecA
MVHHLEQALKAHALFKKDRDYVVREGEIVIVDEFTGRMMIGRRFSEGLHQAIEAKEQVEVKRESQTLATISFQNLFRMYKKLAGMTGTAATEAEEFYKIYKLDVVEIPTNKPVSRKDSPDRIYKSEDAKLNAIVESVRERHEKGQPILIGTVSVSKNELLSKKLKQAGIKHEVLNAKHHEKEAKIITRAGLLGSVTVATNMAGRGTDIKLGEGVREAGGLHVLGTERHEARRIDNQLRGRAGRQGDPGSSQFFVSMDDDLMRIFGGEKLKSLMERLGLPDDMPIENKMISGSIESAQKRVEGYNFDMRKHLVEYDDVMNKHREVIYRKRRRILEMNENNQLTTKKKNEFDEEVIEESTLKEEILDIVHDEIESIINTNIEDKDKAEQEIKAIVGDRSDLTLDTDELKKMTESMYEERESKIGSPVMRQIEVMVYLRTIDMLWVEHLTTMDELRTGIGLRGYGQRDPLIEYKQEAYTLFTNLLRNIESSVARTIFRVEVQVTQPAPMAAAKNVEYTKPDPDTIGGFDADQDAAKSVPSKNITKEDRAVAEKMYSESEDAKNSVTTRVIEKGKTVYDRMKESAATGPASQVKNVKKIGRNDPCPCGSGKKYKKCCGK